MPADSNLPRDLALIGRQPILNVDLETTGYELLYRDGDPRSADGTKATSNVLINAVIEFGLRRVTGHLPAWVNFPESYLAGNLEIPVEPNQLVIEVLEQVAPTDPVINRLAELKSRGYTIALDDFSYNPAFDEFLRLAHVVKLDVREFAGNELKRQVELLSSHPVLLVAEKVETREEFEMCKQLGFSHFQGYFFCEPETLEHRKIPSNRVAVLRVLREVMSPDADLRRVGDIVAQDAALSYRLLRALNSASFALRQPIDSVQNAVVMLGLDMVRSLVTLMALHQRGNHPGELITIALMRGRLCEEVARLLRYEPPSMFFTVGLFSVLDAMLRMPMVELLDRVPISTEVRKALLAHEGRPGEVLKIVMAHERGDFRDLLVAGLDVERYRNAWLDSVAWAENIRQAVNA